jgi:phage shock protein A
VQAEAVETGTLLQDQCIDLEASLDEATDREHALADELMALQEKVLILFQHLYDHVLLWSSCSQDDIVRYC